MKQRRCDKCIYLVSTSKSIRQGQTVYYVTSKQVYAHINNYNIKLIPVMMKTFLHSHLVCVCIDDAEDHVFDGHVVMDDLEPCKGDIVDINLNY